LLTLFRGVLSVAVVSGKRRGETLVLGEKAHTKWRGLLSIDTNTKALTYSGNYFAFPHYSKLIHRGARVFSSSGELPGVHYVAAENPDKSRVLVLTNSTTADQPVQCRLSSRVLKVVLPPDSITSFIWS
jgi:glucosylceramidase